MAEVIPQEVVGLRLHKIVAEKLSACEAVIFVGGRSSVDVALRRAEVSGRVEIGGDVGDYFADLIGSDFTIHETAALDRNSYLALKNHWARCRLEQADG